MTIEERADEIYPMLQPHFDDNAETREAYIKGATEQRAIDIKRACECYCKASSCDINDMQKCVDACLGCEEFRRFYKIIRKEKE